jgi:hypothetical protein
VKITSEGELKRLLREYAENPREGVGFRYEPLPEAISRDVYLALDDGGREFYVPDEDSVRITGRLDRGAVEGVYDRYVRSPGSYNAWLVNR